MKAPALLGVIWIICSLVGCAKHHIQAKPGQVDGRLPVVDAAKRQCLTGYINLYDCDFSKAQPVCKDMDFKNIQYDAACIQIIVKEKK